jgi:FdhE protein
MRAARAEALATQSAAATEPLRFAAGLFRVQAAMVSAPAQSAPRLLLEYAAERGPAELARDARSAGDAGLAQRVSAYRSGGPFDFLARAALVPQALLQREKGAFMGRGAGPCPYCGGIPWMASRRSGSSADGAMRILHCATCWHSWQVARIRCPACGEDPAVRIEACESCGGYLKSIDLTLDARPIPEVDDLTSMALDLWAAEQGFERLEPGLAGL